MIGRKREIAVLNECLESRESQFVAVYGRRRIGKTMLVREAYAGRFTFLHTGLANVGMVDLCEIKYSFRPYKVTLPVNEELRRKRWRFVEETQTKRGVRTVLIAAEGVADGSYRGEFHSLVTGDDLFAV